MTEAAVQTSSVLTPGRHLILADEVAMPAEARPREASISAIADWLVDDARRLPSATRFVDAFAWRMLAAGMPLLRVPCIAASFTRSFLALLTPGGGPRGARKR
jgi:hypothetical protein